MAYLERRARSATRMTAAQNHLRSAFTTPWRVRRHLIRIVLQPFVRVKLKLLGAELGANVALFGSPVVRIYRGSHIRIGTGVKLRSSWASNVLGLAHPVILTTLSAQALIEIGDGVGLSGTSITAATQIRIGEGSLIGADTLITDTDHHQLDEGHWVDDAALVRTAPVTIGKNVFVGARSIVLKGSTIGDGSVIGAGSVVSGTVKPGAVVAGNPARQIGWAPGVEVVESGGTLRPN